MRSHLRLAFATSAIVSAVGCAPDFDTTRPTDTHTFGERVMTLMCKRIAFQADPTDVGGSHFHDACDGGDPPADPTTPAPLVALFANRAALVKSIDTAVPEASLDDLQSFLTSDKVLALYDDNTMETAVVNVGDLLEEIAHDADAMAALARTGIRIGYRPPSAAFGVPGALVNARRAPSPGTAASGAVTPSVHDVLAQTVPALTAGGAAEGEWTALTAAISATLLDAAAPADAAQPTRTAQLAANLLVTERADLGETTPVSLVHRDGRGIARIAAVGGKLPAPFVDLDKDGLPDVDDLGRYVDATGQLIASASPFVTIDDTAARDDQGRDATFTYLSLDKTVIGALSHDTAALFDPDKRTALDLARGASALLGPRVAATKQFTTTGASLTYQGYDLTQSPMLDMMYGWTQLLGDPNVDDLLALADTLLANHAPTTARLIEAAIATSRLGDAHPEAQIVARAPLWDDMLPVIRQIVGKPALVQALTKALELPATKLLARRFSDMMAFKDRFDINQNDQSLIGDFKTAVDRTKVDSGFDRSVFERFLHLLNDSNHAQLCNKPNARVSLAGIDYPLIILPGFQPCAMIEIDNLATFFVESIAYAKDGSGNVICEDANGNPTGCTANGARPRPAATMTFKDGLLAAAIGLLGDGFLEGQVGITGFRRHPTPQALTRVLFLNPLPAFLTTALDPVKDRDGDVYNVQHAGTLPVLEKNNFYDQFRPIAQAFVDNGSEQVLVDLLSVLHKHWSSAASTSTQHTNPAGANFSLGSNGVSWEPLVVDALAGDLMPALVDSAPELDAITANGKPYQAVLTNAASYFVAPQAGLVDRQGRTTSTTSDGKPVTQLSPWQLLADAYVAKQARITATADEGGAWLNGVRGTVDVLFRADHDAAANTWAFHDPRTPPVSRALIALLRDRLAAHKPDRAAWVTQTLRDDTRDLLTHPVFAALADLTAKLTAEGAPRTALESLLHDSFDETASPSVFAMLRTGAADLIQLLADDDDLVPISHLAGRLLVSDKAYLPTQLSFLQQLAQADDRAILVRLVSDLFSSYDAADPGNPAVGEIADGTGEIDRAAPSAAKPAWTATDFSTVFENVAGFLREQQRGLPRFLAIVKDRKP
jgi:hypothetical protein